MKGFHILSKLALNCDNNIRCLNKKLIALALLAGSLQIASATTFSFLVMPWLSSYDALIHQASYTYGHTKNDTSFSLLFAFDNEVTKPIAQKSCEFIDYLDFNDNVWRDVKNNKPNWRYRLLFGVNKQWTDNYVEYNMQGDGKMTIHLYDSGITEHNGKWKVKKISFAAVNLRAEDGVLATEYPEVPCAITINGHTITLSDNVAAQTYICEFPEDEQWMNKIEFSSVDCAAVGLTKFTIHVDDAEGFNSSDSNAARVELNSSGEYYLPNPKVGNLSNIFEGYYDFHLYDSDGNPVDYTFIKRPDMDGFDLQPNSTNSILDAGRYYACYSVNPSEIAFPLNYDDGVPFEILPTVEGMAINWAALEKTGPRTYKCAPHPAIEMTGAQNETITRGWSNAHIDGHMKGTDVYWKQLSNDEQEEFRTAALAEAEVAPVNARHAIVKRATAEIPAGYSKLSSSGVDLSAGTGEESGALGLVLKRNGVVSDPIMVEYTKGEDIPTGISSVDTEQPGVTTWYTLDGRPAEPSSLTVPAVLIKITVYSDGTVSTEKAIVR